MTKEDFFKMSASKQAVMLVNEGQILSEQRQFGNWKVVYKLHDFQVNVEFGADATHPAKIEK
jgi:hypothetical protein